jgi:hypothetical protein
MGAMSGIGDRQRRREAKFERDTAYALATGGAPPEPLPTPDTSPGVDVTCDRGHPVITLGRLRHVDGQWTTRSTKLLIPAPNGQLVANFYCRTCRYDVRRNMAELTVGLDALLALRPGVVTTVPARVLVH